MIEDILRHPDDHFFMGELMWAKHLLRCEEHKLKVTKEALAEAISKGATEKELGSMQLILTEREKAVKSHQHWLMKNLEWQARRDRRQAWLESDAFEDWQNMYNAYIYQRLLNDEM
jgi:hypothetical protein